MTDSNIQTQITKDVQELTEKIMNVIGDHFEGSSINALTASAAMGAANGCYIHSLTLEQKIEICTRFCETMFKYADVPLMVAPRTGGVQ